jgi:hypothetical protein
LALRRTSARSWPTKPPAPVIRIFMWGVWWFFVIWVWV